MQVHWKKKEKLTDHPFVGIVQGGRIHGNYNNSTFGYNIYNLLSQEG